jgi:hypothetical protein
VSTRCLARFAAAALVAALVAGCGRPLDETQLRFLGFQDAGSTGTGTVSSIEGDVSDGAPLKVDAYFENHVTAPDAIVGGVGITITRVDVDYTMKNLDPPSFSFATSLYVPPPSGKDATAGDKVALSDLPIVPVSVKNWLIHNGASHGTGIIEMKAQVTFVAATDAGDTLTVRGALAVTLTEKVTPPTAEAEVTISASVPNAIRNPLTSGEFTVFRSGDTTNAVIVSYGVDAASTATAGTTCAVGVDYVTLSGSVAIAAGGTSGKIQVRVCAGGTGSPETVIVNLGSGSGYKVSQPSSATVTIRDTN